MPRGIYTDFKCTKKHGKFTPQDHQAFVRDYFIKSPYKGLLLFHRLGSGKTCSSIIIGDALLKLKDIKRVYVFSPGSLRSGWIEEYCGVCGANSKLLEKRYTFVTYNYNVYKSLPKNFDNSLIIIDEVHNFINNVKNESANSLSIYNKLMTSKCKILALSGTPIFNNIYEWPILGNLLKPGTFTKMGSFAKGPFMKTLNISKQGIVTPKNPAEFNAQLEGIISYFPGLGGNLYPELIEEEIIKVKMTPHQELKYWAAFDTEQIYYYKKIKPELKYQNPAEYERQKRLVIMAKKRVLSRQPSNFAYPAAIYSMQERPPDAVAPKGWVEPKYFNKRQLLKKYSTKVAALYYNILNNFNAKHMVFTFFKEHSGVNVLKAIFEMCGLKTATFSGDLSDSQRAKLLKEYNDPANRYGDNIKVIFVTDAGAEGITLKETGHIHILESDPRENKIQQAIGRAVRYKSHINMPPKLQKVHLWRYWSISGEEPGKQLKTTKFKLLPDGEMAEKEKVYKVGPKTIDEILYEQGQYKMNTLNSFMQLLIDSSIEN